jgi:GNAT superfamily N-acetyltransferase
LLNVRNALPEDSESIGALYRQLVQNSAVDVQASQIELVSKDKGTALFVCEHDQVVRGTALVSLCADVMFGSQPFAVVENVIVHESYRAQGLGTALLEEVERFCFLNNCSKIMLLSASQRIEAHQFFESVGFSGTVKAGFVKYRRQFKSVL